MLEDDNVNTVTSSSFDYRAQRFQSVCLAWGLEQLRPLVGRWEVPQDLWQQLVGAASIYGARCLGEPASWRDLDETLDAYRDRRTNVTPNGALVPKFEFQLEYNLVLAAWFKVFGSMIAPRPDLVRDIRTTPNIRVKFAEELSDNEARALNTAIPHSDAWVEGPWGFNCYVPLLGDVLNNTLLYWNIDEDSFRDEFLTANPSYFENQWVLEHIEPDYGLQTPSGYVYLSDFAVVHATTRKPGARARMSIDTTVMVGDHEVHPDRTDEYVQELPAIGVRDFVVIGRSERDAVGEKTTEFSHYLTGSRRTVQLP